MAPLRCGDSELLWGTRVMRGALALLGLALLPGSVQAQLRSNIASVTLVAYSAPAVHWQAAGPAAQPVGASSIANLVGMTVNTTYRIEQRGPDRIRVVLLPRGEAGVVPWERIRTAMGPSEGPVLVDLVVAPTL